MTAPVRVATFEMTLSGPTGNRDAAVKALSGAGFDRVEPIDCPYLNDGAEATKGWVVAVRHGLVGEPIDTDGQAWWMNAAAEALGDLGYELRLHSVGWTRPAGEVA